MHSASERFEISSWYKTNCSAEGKRDYQVDCVLSKNILGKPQTSQNTILKNQLKKREISPYQEGHGSFFSK